MGGTAKVTSPPPGSQIALRGQKLTLLSREMAPSDTKALAPSAETQPAPPKAKHKGQEERPQNSFKNAGLQDKNTVSIKQTNPESHASGFNPLVFSGFKGKKNQTPVAFQGMANRFEISNAGAQGFVRVFPGVFLLPKDEIVDGSFQATRLYNQRFNLGYTADFYFGGPNAGLYSIGFYYTNGIQNLRDLAKGPGVQKEHVYKRVGATLGVAKRDIGFHTGGQRAKFFMGFGGGDYKIGLGALLCTPLANTACPEKPLEAIAMNDRILIKAGAQISGKKKNRSIAFSAGFGVLSSKAFANFSQGPNSNLVPMTIEGRIYFGDFAQAASEDFLYQEGRGNIGLSSQIIGGAFVNALQARAIGITSGRVAQLLPTFGKDEELLSQMTLLRGFNSIQLGLQAGSSPWAEAFYNGKVGEKVTLGITWGAQWAFAGARMANSKERFQSYASKLQMVSYGVQSALTAVELTEHYVPALSHNHFIKNGFSGGAKSFSPWIFTAAEGITGLYLIGYSLSQSLSLFNFAPVSEAEERDVAFNTEATRYGMRAQGRLDATAIAGWGLASRAFKRALGLASRRNGYLNNLFVKSRPEYGGRPWGILTFRPPDLGQGLMVGLNIAIDGVN